MMGLKRKNENVFGSNITCCKKEGQLL